jgi:hypothetical protein
LTVEPKGDDRVLVHGLGYRDPAGNRLLAGIAGQVRVGSEMPLSLSRFSKMVSLYY